MIRVLYQLKNRSNLHLIVGFLISLIITILVSYKVLPSSGALSYIDHAYFFNHENNSQDIASTVTPNYFGHSQTNSIFLYVPRLLLISLLSSIGLDDATISYLLFFGVFLLCSYIYFVLVYKLSHNIYYSILSQVILVINNLSLEHIIFGSAFFYYLSLIGFALILYNIYNICIENKFYVKHIIYIMCSSILLVHPFFFIMFMIIWGLFAFYDLLKNKFTNIKKILFTAVGAILLQSYWLITFLNGLFYNDPTDVYGSQNVDSVMDGFNKVSSYLNVINGYQYFNFAAKIFQGSDFNYIFYPSLIFITFISYLYFNKKIYNKRFVNFGIILFFIFLHLSLGPNSRVVGGVWSWMWENVSAFQFFRSFSRFQIILLPLIIFVFLDFDKVWKYKYKNLFYIIITLVIITLNIRMFTGNLDGNIVSIKIPEQYSEINEILNRDERKSNIISLPYSLYESYSWANNKEYGVMLKDYYLKDYIFTKPIIYDRAAMDLSGKNKLFKSIFKDNDFAKLEKLNTGYILLQKDLIDVLNESAPISWEGIKEKLDKDKNNFEKLIENEYYVFYKYLPYSAPIISNSDSKFTQINPWHYEVKIKKENLNENQELILLKNYDKNWKVYIEEKDHQYNCTEKQQNIDFKDNYIWSQQCEEKNKSNRLVLFMQEINLLFNNKTFSPDKYDSYGNKWSIPIENFDNLKNKNDIIITIYYKPQIYFYIGVIITAITILATSTYFLFTIYREILRKKLTNK